ncbi:MAG: hypothetical protein M3220_01860, partial [Chloroflexota bacterium]|nr:hypothetical protein [Chloroflexota bacterium]
MPEQHAYPNGYGYQALLLFLIHLTGVDLISFQLLGRLFLAVSLVVPTWLLYRELAGSAPAAMLATALLFIQPEFLFSILRGTHEKFSRVLMLLSLYILIRSLHSPKSLSRLTSWILAAYLAIYAQIAFNNLLATSFIVAILLSLLFSCVVLRRSPSTSSVATPAIQRLLYTVVVSLGLSSLFTFYLYQPAKHDLLVLESLWQRLLLLLLDIETFTNPYGTVEKTWVSLPVYLLSSLANWLLLATSALIWSCQTLHWLRDRRALSETNHVLLWAFYAAFALLSALTVVLDFSGALAANLQHRIFPSFAIFAAPLVARFLVERYPPQRATTPLLWTGVWATIALLSIFSTLKALNDPRICNKWLFHLPSEMEAIAWSEHALTGRGLWLGYDERLSTAYGIRAARSVDPMHWNTSTWDPKTPNLLISDVTRQHAERLQQPLPLQA